jgi:hypothetical protein
METYKNIKIIEVGEDYLIGVKGYSFYKYSFNKNNKWIYYSKVKDFKYSLLSNFVLLKRLFRAEITNLYSLSDGSQLCIAKKGIFRKSKDKNIFEKCFKIDRGSRPLNLCIDENENLFFGEYFQNENRENVNIYSSSDKGISWRKIFTFPSGIIRHIHAIQYDPFTNLIWVITGDDEGECIIGYTSDKFKTFNTKFRGNQEFRTCRLFFYKDFIAFATDSPFIENQIKIFSRDNSKILNLNKIQGSVIKGGQCKNISFFSTAVEKSSVNICKESHLWITKDGLNWSDVYKDKKDSLPLIFQFGTFEFPNYITNIMNKFYFSGRALTKTGNKSIVISI